MRFDTLQGWLDWQSRLHPQAMDLGLDRVAAVWQRLGHGAFACPVISVAGTNGKGSCVAMLEATALAAGYRCGAYGSPHLVRYNERIRIDGEPVDDAALIGAFDRIDQARGETSLTYFEFATLAALDLFARAGLDLVVLEVGLGGRLDAVNLIDADVAVVTSIGRDHTAWLGDSLEEIAVEKAGIFRAGRAAVIGQQDAPAALRATALEIGARPLQLGVEFARHAAESGWSWQGPDGRRYALALPAMRGDFQCDNAAAAIAALDALRERLPISRNALRQGLGRARLPGRFQVLSGPPSYLLDVAHNAPAAAALAANLRVFASRGQAVRVVLAMLSDKEPEALLAALADQVTHWYLTETEDARAMPRETLHARLLTAGLDEAACTLCVDPQEALASAAAASDAEDCVLVCGSFTTVGAALRLLGHG
ncbi:bifunctional tetrahydrofolate synthase/dihydrofolate synthase [Marichromatium bheemlicum]|uniref:Dihydrofolate synthase/folylpolyglutamate synthase n=1 Tax=Marichromatium bheemlicum TaxID=365339 RepID=A0ABX1I6Y0_9GAMM|nr:bifunctional tetrahydrofolate synthase/dihydrofolate synthase [Marichromatium bheemlicum]NKN33242.1 bifunctional tetrahydrofolate synthase/dihydrofolate synthase [Marichromatium bheemlicum]